VERYGFCDRTDRLVDVIVPALESKEKVVALSLEHLRLPTNSASLEYLDHVSGFWRNSRFRLQIELHLVEFICLFRA
jgi:hypothetical protein